MPLVTGLDGRLYEIPEDVLSKAQIADNAIADLGKLGDLPDAPPVVPVSSPQTIPQNVNVVGGKSPYVNVKPGPNNGVIIEVSPNPRQD